MLCHRCRPLCRTDWLQRHRKRHPWIMIIKEAGFKSIRIFVIRDVVLGEDKKVIYLIIVKNQFSWDKRHNISILFML